MTTVPLMAYAGAAAAFLALDFVWLNLAGRYLYRPYLGDLLADEPNLAVAALFYLVYVAGIVVFAVMPGLAAKSMLMTAALGALLGLVAYGTYDITNLATLRGWPVIVSVVDLAWGICVTATAATAGHLAARAVSGG